MALEDIFQSLLMKRESRSLQRSLTLQTKTLIDFSSNSYLSLGTNPNVQACFLSLIHQYDALNLIGSGGSRLLDGNTEFIQSLESQIASTHGAPAALIFNSGFDANMGIFASVPQPGDVIVYDELIHASIHDGMKLSRASHRIPFRHNTIFSQCEAATTSSNMNLFNTLQALGAEVLNGLKNVFIAVEGVYSMDGDVCPLVDVVKCVDMALPNGNGYIIIDEAHSTGVLGEGGRGLACQHGLEDKMFIRLHTFGKAMGCSGAAVLCSDITRSYLINYARSFIYTTAPSLTFLFAIKAGYDFLANGDVGAVIRHVHNLTSYTHKQLIIMNRRLQPPEAILSVQQRAPESPIIPVITPSPRKLAKFCQESGFMVRPIVAPTVPMGKERIRICLHAVNTKADVNGLVKAIEAWASKMMTVGSTSKL